MEFLIDIVLNNYILIDLTMEIEEMGEEFQFMYLASEIVDGTFKFFKIERITLDSGKPPFE